MNLEKASVKLAYMLRHSKDPQYVSADGGWAQVDQVLEVLRTSFPDMNQAHLERIVSMDKKGRFSFNETGDRIRANQGHSIPGVEVEMKQVQPPQILYHGTASRFLDTILCEGLKPMSRQFVHISSDYDTALTVGKRHGAPVVLLVQAGDMVKDGFEFYQSFNGVWQTREVPAQYLSIYEA